MNPRPKPPLKASWWIIALIPGLLGVDAACSFKSLDYLKSGDLRDADLTPSGIDGQMNVGPSPDDASSGMGEGGGGGSTIGTPDAGDDVSTISTGGAGQDANGGTDGVVSTGGTAGPASTGGAGGVGGTPGTSSVGGKGGTIAPGSTAGIVQTGGSGRAGSVGSSSATGGGAGTTATGGQATGGTSSGGSPGGTGGTLTPDAGPDAFVPSDATKTRTALFVVGSTNLNTGDAKIRSHLTEKGVTVTVVSDSNIPSNVSQDIILISRTISSANVGTKFRASSKPVMVWEPELYDNMGMIDASSSSKGNSSPFTTLDLSSTAGALAAGLSGSVTFANVEVEVSWGVPNANAIEVASLPGVPSRWPIFAYETGAQMPGLKAPARRAGFFFSKTSAVNVTDNGWRLFDTLFDWLVS